MKTTFLVLSFLFTQMSFAQECRLRTPVRLAVSPLEGKQAVFKGVTLSLIPDESYSRWHDARNGTFKLILLQPNVRADWSQPEARSGFLAARFDTDFTEDDSLGVGFSDIYIGSHDLRGSTVTENGVTTYTTIDNSPAWAPKTVSIKVQNGYVISVEFSWPRVKDGQYVRPITFDPICVLDMHE